MHHCRLCRQNINRAHQCSTWQVAKMTRARQPLQKPKVLVNFMLAAQMMNQEAQPSPSFSNLDQKVTPALQGTCAGLSSPADDSQIEQLGAHAWDPVLKLSSQLSLGLATASPPSRSTRRSGCETTILEPLDAAARAQGHRCLPAAQCRSAAGSGVTPG